MFHIKNISKEEFAFAVRITDQMSWGLTEQDFEFMLELEPKGCFILLEDSERIGLATTVSFGKIGWFGNLVVDESKRNRGAGSLLVKHALKYLVDKKVQTVGLYAYMERIPFYKKLGFECNSEFIVLKGKGFSSPFGANVRKAEGEEMSKILSFDHSCFGVSRKKMLEPILSDPDNLCYVSVQKGDISGYAVAKVFRGVAEVGPLVCKEGQTRSAVDLLRATLNGLEGLQVSMFVPRKEDAILSMVMERGFRQSFKVERMFYGPAVARDCVYMAESLERG